MGRTIQNAETGNGLFEVEAGIGHLSPAAHAEFFKRLNELLDEFTDKYGTHDAPPNHALFVAYYPVSEEPAE